MNDIQANNDFHNPVYSDTRLNPRHLNLYCALFDLWKYKAFPESFRITRKDLMKATPIKSIATYHKCITDLHELGYIIYQPSYNPKEGSLVAISKMVCNSPRH